MQVVLIIIAYIVITAIELPPLLMDKRKREAVFFMIFMLIAFAETIAIMTMEDIPTVASVIRKILSPILNLKIIGANL
jgi:uncharacterized membrane protein YwzB